MNLNPLTALLEVGKTALDKFIPDPAQKAEAALKLEQLAAQGRSEELQAEVQILLGQVRINEAEAASENLFKSGWRPAIGWTCAISLFTYYVPYCLVATIIWAIHCIETKTLAARPDLGIADLIGLTVAMLGIAGMRSFDKLTLLKK